MRGASGELVVHVLALIMLFLVDNVLILLAVGCQGLADSQHDDFPLTRQHLVNTGILI